DAEKKLAELVKTMSSGDEQRPYVQAYLAEAKIQQNKTEGVAKELEGIIKGTSDGRLRGLAYNLLGDLYRGTGKTEDALGAYLRVDALYNDDPDEHAKALYYLSELYRKRQKPDPARAEDCVERLREPRFASSPYQKMLPPKEDAEKDKEKEKEKEPKKDKD